MLNLLRRFQLDQDGGGRGLSCDERGVSLAGVPLLIKTALGIEPRPFAELDALLKAAYGQALSADALARGLSVAARALNAGDLPLAKIATLYLRLPELDQAAATRLAQADADLAKYDPDEPRDWRGRWTTGGNETGSPPPATPPLSQPSTPALRPKSPQRPSSPAATTATSVEDHARDWGGPSHPTGGHLYLTEGEADVEEGDEPPGAEPLVDPDRLPRDPRPRDWETPEGLVPRLADGRIWPKGTLDIVRPMLEPRPDGKPPVVILYVPRDGRGPVLLGMTDKEEFVQPKNYDRVMLIGTPQVTRAGGVETRHAEDSLAEGLSLASTNRFSTIFFNRSFSTITNGERTELIRPDVLAVVRPELDLGYRYWPYESLSPGQTKEERQDQMPSFPGLRDIEARRYKLLIKLLRSLGLIS